MSSQNFALDGLADIDWRNLHHAYGSAEDVPDQLRSLAEGDDSVLWDLFGNIHHQGSVYEATAYAIPFLWRLLAAHGEVGHSGIAALLGSIASASGDSTSHWTVQIREEIQKGAEIALRLLASSHEAARRGAVCILASTTGLANTLVPSLNDVLRANCSLHERAMIGLALAALGHYKEEAFADHGLEFFSKAKHLAQGAAKGDAAAKSICRLILIEAIEIDPDDLSNWTD